MKHIYVAMMLRNFIYLMQAQSLLKFPDQRSRILLKNPIVEMLYPLPEIIIAAQKTNQPNKPTFKKGGKWRYSSYVDIYCLPVNEAHGKTVSLWSISVLPLSTKFVKWRTNPQISWVTYATLRDPKGDRNVSWSQHLRTLTMRKA